MRALPFVVVAVVSGLLGATVSQHVADPGSADAERRATELAREVEALRSELKARTPALAVGTFPASTAIEELASRPATADPAQPAAARTRPAPVAPPDDAAYQSLVRERWRKPTEEEFAIIVGHVGPNKTSGVQLTDFQATELARYVRESGDGEAYNAYSLIAGNHLDPNSPYGRRAMEESDEAMARMRDFVVKMLTDDQRAVLDSYLRRTRKKSFGTYTVDPAGEDK